MSNLHSLFYQNSDLKNAILLATHDNFLKKSLLILVIPSSHQSPLIRLFKLFILWPQFIINRYKTKNFQYLYNIIFIVT